jgi:hypothetical protein
MVFAQNGRQARMAIPARLARPTTTKGTKTMSTMTKLWIAFGGLFLTMVYLTIDWAVSEYRQAKRERDELENHHKQ